MKVTNNLTPIVTLFYRTRFKCLYKWIHMGQNFIFQHSCCMSAEVSTSTLALLMLVLPRSSNILKNLEVLAVSSCT